MKYCDRSGNLLPADKLVKEYVYVGHKLVWNGLLVDPKVLFKPNEFDRPAKNYGDPKSIKDPRPFR